MLVGQFCCNTLGHHDCRHVRRDRRNFGQDRRIDDTQGFDTADGMKLDSQVAQLVSAMAAYTSANPGFDATTATQMPDDPPLRLVYRRPGTPRSER